MRTPRPLLCALAGAALAACTTVPEMGNVIPGENGLYRVIATGESEKIALQSALHSAEATCKGRGQRHIVIDQRTEYRGIVSETTMQAIEQAQRVFSAGTGQSLPRLAGEEDYRITLQFRCEG